MEPISEELAGILAATVIAEADALTPRVALTGVHGADTVSVIECVMPVPDLEGDGYTVKDGYLWHAVVGSFVLLPGYMVDGHPVPGRQVGGVLISTSTKSARAALANAQRRLAKAR